MIFDVLNSSLLFKPDLQISKPPVFTWLVPRASIPEIFVCLYGYPGDRHPMQRVITAASGNSQPRLPSFISFLPWCYFCSLCCTGNWVAWLLAIPMLTRCGPAIQLSRGNTAAPAMELRCCFTAWVPASRWIPRQSLLWVGPANIAPFQNSGIMIGWTGGYALCGSFGTAGVCTGSVLLLRQWALYCSSKRILIPSCCNLSVNGAWCVCRAPISPPLPTAVKISRPETRARARIRYHLRCRGAKPFLCLSGSFSLFRRSVRMGIFRLQLNNRVGIRNPRSANPLSIISCWRFAALW